MDNLQLAQLESLLDKDILIAEELKHLLEAEKSALVQRNPEALQKLVDHKMNLLEQLDNHHQHKAQLAGQASGEEIEWKSFLQKLQAGNQQLNVPLEKLEYFKEVLQQVESMNQVNARIASRMEKSLAELINLLKGNIQKQALYTHQGNAQSSATHHTIAKA